MGSDNVSQPRPSSDAKSRNRQRISISAANTTFRYRCLPAEGWIPASSRRILVVRQMPNIGATPSKE